jgi:mono/diheme cytochrome c family protein
MKFNRILVAGVAALMVSGYCAAQTVDAMGEVYKNRCANCHGDQAKGVSKLEEMPGVSPQKADAQGMASEERPETYGPPLSFMSREQLLHKLIDLRSKGFESQSYHSVMRKNLKTIEAREGEISDEAMAEYIYTHFGDGAQ